MYQSLSEATPDHTHKQLQQYINHMHDIDVTIHVGALYNS